MRISDWRSDVCSSDLTAQQHVHFCKIAWLATFCRIPEHAETINHTGQTVCHDSQCGPDTCKQKSRRNGELNGIGNCRDIDGVLHGFLNSIKERVCFQVS